jgi:hypothetical protein
VFFQRLCKGLSLTHKDNFSYILCLKKQRLINSTNQKEIAMKSSFIAVFLIAAFAICAAAGMKEDCQIVHERFPLQEIELTPDGDDLLLTGFSAKDEVIVCRADGLTGVPSDPQVVATDFSGTGWQGPEFHETADQGICVYYAGPSGVQATCRVGGVWGFDIFGNYRGGSSTMPATEPGRYPGIFLNGLKSYNEGGPQVQPHLGLNTDELLTPFSAINAYGIEIARRGACHPTLDGWWIFAGCELAGCALYEARTDGSGGFAEVNRLSQYNAARGYAEVAGGIHPQTGAIIYFVGYGRTLEVWEAFGEHEAPSLVARHAGLSWRPEHFRIVYTPDNVHLHALDKLRPGRGSYLLSYGEEPRKILKIGLGVELAYLPQAETLAQFFVFEKQLYMCLVD